ncbi:uncharacterized protein TNCV_3683361 [Trichonephila clavipes]|nr:uncharacterized protein TNCV_3683361 [Trichonephila clavipes]
MTALCGFTAEFMLGLFLFLTFTPQCPKRCSVTSARYSELLQQQIILALQERQCLQIISFMQDGTTLHIGRQVKALLSVNFANNRVISRHFSGCMVFSFTRLKSCDFWFWRFIKLHTYRREIGTLPDLKVVLIHHEAEIPRELLRVTIENAIMRFQHVIDFNRLHIEHILYMNKF